MKIYFKKELLGNIVSTWEGNEFPWSDGKIIPTDKMNGLLKYIDWANCQIDVDVYNPYDHELYEVEDPKYPVDNSKRFLLSDNWKLMQLIDKFIEYAETIKKTKIEMEEISHIPGLEEFSKWWSSDYYNFHETFLSVEDMLAYREFLYFDHWRVEDDEGNEVPYFSYPLRFNTKTFGISWR